MVRNGIAGEVQICILLLEPVYRIDEEPVGKTFLEFGERWGYTSVLGPAYMIGLEQNDISDHHRLLK